MRTWVEISQKAIENNVKVFKSALTKLTKLMVVVKADAYGHGAIQVSKIALRAGADALAVATCEEAVLIRKNKIDAPILILGAAFDDDIENIIEYDITPAVISYEFAKKLSERAVLKSKTVNIHIKVDTGMSRIGYLYNDENYLAEIMKIHKLPNIKIEGIFSHLSKADETDRTFTDTQFKRFEMVCQNLENNGINIPVKHICNSAGLIDYPKYHLDMVRLGISLYGYYPSDVFDESHVKIEPAMTFKTRVVNVKELPENVAVGYGGTYITNKKTKIATIAVGYADGYPRSLSNTGYVGIDGVKCKILGNVCMDQVMVDASQVKNIKFGDEVILFGKSGNNNITVEEIAALAGTINYEMLCHIGKRVPRIYIE